MPDNTKANSRQTDRFAQTFSLPFFKVYPPPLSLTSLVREIQVYHIKWDEEKNLPEPFLTCLANTEQNLYFYINDPVKVIPAERLEITCPPVIVTGPKSKPVGLLFGKNHLMIKVAFHPTGTYRLLGIPMQQTVNTGLDAKELWGEEVNNLISKLKQTPLYDEMVDVIISFLEEKNDSVCRPEESIDAVAIQMSDPLNSFSQEEWASRSHLSLRQFERNFITRIGISPKLFVRIVRFEHAMKIKNACPEKNWSSIAAECNYTDSSHLLREFKEFAEFPPSKFYLGATSGYSDFSTG